MDTNKTNQIPAEEAPLTPDEIKAIGEIELGPAKHEVFLNKHYKKLIIGGVALIVAATAGIAWYAYGEQQEEDAASALIDACGITTETAAPSPITYDVKALDKVKEDYASTNAARTADVFLMQNKMASAEPNIELCKKMADSAESDECRLPACMHLALYYMKKNQYAEAVTYFKKIADASSNAYTNQACKYLAYIFLQQGDKAQAEKYLEKMSNKSVDDAYTTLKDKIRGGYELTAAPKPVAAEQNASEEPKLEVEPTSEDILQSKDDIFTKDIPSSSETDGIDLLQTPSTLPGVGTTGDAPSTL